MNILHAILLDRLSRVVSREEHEKIRPHLERLESSGSVIPAGQYRRWMGERLALDPGRLDAVFEDAGLLTIMESLDFAQWISGLGVLPAEEAAAWEERNRRLLEKGEPAVGIVEHCSGLADFKGRECLGLLWQARRTLPEGHDPLLGVTGLRLGDYVVEKRLRVTQRSVLFQARPLFHQGAFLCKFPRQGASAVEEELSCAMQNAVRHPGILPLVHYGLHQGLCYRIMPLWGEPMDLHTSGERLSPGVIFPLLAGVAEAVEALHSAGICHLDIKPANILVKDGIARLSDFDASSHEGRPRQNSGLYTKRYASPEQVRQGRYGRPSDVFSLGLSLIDLLAGRVVQSGRRAFGDISYETLEDDCREALRAACPLDEGLARMILSMVSVEAEKRPSAGQVRGCLRLLAGSPELASPRSPQGSASRAVRIPPSGLAAAAEAVGLAKELLSRAPRPAGPGHGRFSETLPRLRKLLDLLSDGGGAGSGKIQSPVMRMSSVLRLSFDRLSPDLDLPLLRKAAVSLELLLLAHRLMPPEEEERLRSIWDAPGLLRAVDAEERLAELRFLSGSFMGVAGTLRNAFGEASAALPELAQSLAGSSAEAAACRMMELWRIVHCPWPASQRAECLRLLSLQISSLLGGAADILPLLRAAYFSREEASTPIALRAIPASGLEIPSSAEYHGSLGAPFYLRAWYSELSAARETPADRTERGSILDLHARLGSFLAVLCLQAAGRGSLLDEYRRNPSPMRYYGALCAILRDFPADRFPPASHAILAEIYRNLCRRNSFLWTDGQLESMSAPVPAYSLPFLLNQLLESAACLSPLTRLYVFQKTRRGGVFLCCSDASYRQVSHEAFSKGREDDEAGIWLACHPSDGLSERYRLSPWLDIRDGALVVPSPEGED